MSLATALKSYLRDWIIRSVSSRSHLSLLMIIPIIGLASSGSESNSSLLDYCEMSNNQQKMNKQTTDKESKHSTEENESLASAAYGYARQSQSSPDGNNDTMSIGVQKQHINSIAEKFELKIADIFVDMNESGFSFDRDGFKNLEEHLEQDRRPVILDRVNRLGRNTLETIHVAATIHYEYEVEANQLKTGFERHGIRLEKNSKKKESGTHGSPILAWGTNCQRMKTGRELFQEDLK